VWHIDGNDKIKPYGFGISGCIDGFSQQLLWLNVYTTNKDPAIIGGYFLQAVRELSGAPVFVRADLGTENVIVRDIQTQLMGNGRNGHNKCYIEGTSKLNQRIESFWCQLRKQCLGFWMTFHAVKEDGNFTGDFVDENVLRFCFMPLIQVNHHLVCILLYFSTKNVIRWTTSFMIASAAEISCKYNENHSLSSISYSYNIYRKSLSINFACVVQF